MTELLRPLSFPLRGSRLIEASAGTGKTFTIAALYLRLVLGHGAGGSAFTRALTPPEILVVTFTDAATGELRDRIRARLVEASICFSVDPALVVLKPPGEDFLHDLRAEYPQADWAACARRLRLAADGMDEAAISTIHGWCNRMLREHAFDSDSLFTQTLEPNQDEMVAEAVRDYWRTFYYPLDEAAVARVVGWWATPEELRSTIKGLLLLDVGTDPLPDPEAALAKADAESTRLLADLKAPWAAWTEQLREMYSGLIESKQISAPRKGDMNRWLDALRDWSLGDAAGPNLTPTAWKHLSPAGLAEAWRGAGPAPTHEALTAAQTLLRDLATLPDGREDALRHAIQWVARRFACEQDRRAAVGFDNLLRQLAAALSGPNGNRLAALILRQFPVAMIDEFQDTDAVQYRIFDAVYGVARNDQNAALILIGDPKQAIYAFRGADIHTYLEARRDTAGRHSTLGTNFRSTEGMVAAVNHVFSRAEQRAEGRGAFRFRSAGGNPLPFQPVDAWGRQERLLIDDSNAASLTCWWLQQEGTIGSGAHTQRMAQACAAEIVRLLRLGQQGRAGFQSQDGALRPLVANDIAILVNKGLEAVAVRRALEASGVRSVYLSDQESVFASAVAGDMQRWLEACAEPTDGRLLRAALGTATLQLPLDELDRLNHDELHWETRTQQFVDYLQCWRRQGVLPMLRRLLNDFDAPRRLLARGDERTLTDVLHLAELLQVAGEQLEGEHALIRHLEEQRTASDGDPGVRQVRLESDAELVKVVTVHKSKGLEYPLVFLPFASSFRAAKPTDLPLRWHDEDGRLQVRLTSEAGAIELVDAERLGEDLRKLYVALTRARFGTWMGVAPLESFERGALGYLLAGEASVAPADFESMLAAFARNCPHVSVACAPELDGTRYVPTPIPEAAALSLALPQRREHWWIASYSALRLLEPAQPPNAVMPVVENAAEGKYEEARIAERHDAVSGAAASSSDQSAQGLHAFPRGAEAGSFLHGLLEWAGTDGFGKVMDDPVTLHDQVARRCNVQGWSHWIEPLQAWLRTWVTSPLPLASGVAVPPRDLDLVKVEMEFWFGVTQVDTQTLDAIVQRHVLPGCARAALTPAHLNGMLKGFIDLVVEHDGRYYVADYKSNWLGPVDANYTAQAMQEAVLDHRYELQYSLYLFALHRLLSARLPDYDYETHVGGAACIFLRGHAAPTYGAHVERPPRALIEELERLFESALTPESEVQS